MDDVEIQINLVRAAITRYQRECEKMVSSSNRSIRGFSPELQDGYVKGILEKIQREEARLEEFKHLYPEYFI